MFTAIASILILGLACAYDSEQFQIFQPQHNTPYPLKANRIKRFCSKNVCTDSEQEGSYPNTQCTLSNCIKRALQDDVGPFWANRGKKDPTYRQEPLYAEEPRWILVRRAQNNLTPLAYEYEPFFVGGRGKKDKQDDDDKDTIQSIYAKMRVRNHLNSGLRTNE